MVNSEYSIMGKIRIHDNVYGKLVFDKIDFGFFRKTRKTKKCRYLNNFKKLSELLMEENFSIFSFYFNSNKYFLNFFFFFDK